ncbi:5-methyltetrahydropteroyltriglutamate--homocysteine S-methyltransferase [Marinivivus vitaminiproducens]|nr:5-methyltetrahydropteroyltriglutamate--homocysteine S-methyltransferase [Geminicoccaceae bacterium SCSIO 64248]
MTVSSLPVATLGLPRIGPKRELKFALERFWSGQIDEALLQNTAAGLRAANWTRQEMAGVIEIPSNDFSLYDHVLDTSVMVGAIPPAYGWQGGEVPLSTYFAMARGAQPGPANACGCGAATPAGGVPAQEMTKWFDTNYHFMVPEFRRGQTFALASRKPIEHFEEAKAQGVTTRPVLVGPVSFLALGKSADETLDRLSLLPGLLPVYAEVLRALGEAGAAWVQIDEPCLVLDTDERTRDALRLAYETLAREVPSIRLMLTSYFGGLGESLDTVARLPVAGVHLDLVRAPNQFQAALAALPPDRVLSMGVIDGRNIWRADLGHLLDWIEPVVAARDRVQIAPSCSLLHVPMDLESETALDPELRRWLAFAQQKMHELATLGQALAGGRESVQAALDDSADAARSRRTSERIHDKAVAARIEAVTPVMSRRAKPFAERQAQQRQSFALPAFPTTTIGSFPQTAEVRQARAAHTKAEISDADYEAFLRKETEAAIRWQEEIGLDVLVHGEFERNDMVQYFGEQLAGFAFTKSGWVQSYGSRCVRPPILFGDVSRPKPMTVAWWRYSQSLTDRPVKGMLTGPVTILNWSFVRNDVPRSVACRQIALAIRDEVLDLEAAGARIIQIDEAALREGLPLRRSEWQAYLDWAVESFRLCSSGVGDATQIHTHMCYSEFNDIIEAIGAMDADVISIETSRSKMELLGAFSRYRYPNEIGPGVYDIHSPRVPDTREMVDLLGRARERLADGQIWVNPDCGLKTRKWDEVRPALVNMVEAAKALRKTSGQAAK